MSDIEQHDNEWNDRLQDLLDGVAGADRLAVEAHVAGCARCRAQFALLKKLDTQLRRIEPLSPGYSFDQQVFARINAHDAQARDSARRRVERELKDNLATLSKGWRRGLLSLVGGALAGVALVMALLTWTDRSAFTTTLVGAANDAIGGDFTGTLHMFVTCAVGAVIGAIVSRWLVATQD